MKYILLTAFFLLSTILLSAQTIETKYLTIGDGPTEEQTFKWTLNTKSKTLTIETEIGIKKRLKIDKIYEPVIRDSLKRYGFLCTEGGGLITHKIIQAIPLKLEGSRIMFFDYMTAGGREMPVAVYSSETYSAPVTIETHYFAILNSPQDDKNLVKSHHSITLDKTNNAIYIVDDIDNRKTLSITDILPSINRDETNWTTFRCLDGDLQCKFISVIPDNFPKQAAVFILTYLMGETEVMSITYATDIKE